MSFDRQQTARRRSVDGDAQVPALWILNLLVGGRGVREVRIPLDGYWQVVQRAKLIDAGTAVALNLAFLVNPDTGYYSATALDLPVQALVRVQVDFNA